MTFWSAVSEALAAGSIDARFVRPEQSETESTVTVCTAASAAASIAPVLVAALVRLSHCWLASELALELIISLDDELEIKSLGALAEALALASADAEVEASMAMDELVAVTPASAPTVVVPFAPAVVPPVAALVVL